MADQSQIANQKSAIPGNSPAESLDRGFPACGWVDPTADPYDALLTRLRREYVPFHVLWELTHTCNLDCVMCYNAPRPEPELSTAECVDVLAQLAEAGALRLTLTGGEILTRRDFFTIAGKAREFGFALDLKTNGVLMTPETADRIAALAPLQVDISLLGATAATSDAVMRGRNTLAHILRAVKLLQERGVRVKLNTLLLDLNLAERQAMLDLALGLGVAYEQVFKVSAMDDGHAKAAGLQLALQQMTDVLVDDHTPFVLRNPDAGTRTCSVGLSSCLISPYGVVYPCIELRIPAGRLVGARRQRFAEIWAGAPILQQLRMQHTYDNLPECRICPINAYCEGRCAGLAWKEHGDLYGGHTLACRHAQARYAQQHPGEVARETPLQTRLRSGLSPSPLGSAPICLLD